MCIFWHLIAADSGVVILFSEGSQKAISCCDLEDDSDIGQLRLSILRKLLFFIISLPLILQNGTQHQVCHPVSIVFNRVNSAVSRFYLNYFHARKLVSCVCNLPRTRLFSVG